MIVNIWLEIFCSECKKSNWMYNGDGLDDTFFTPYGIKCWNCGHCEIFDKDIVEAEKGECDDIEEFCELGLKTPK